MSDPRPPRLRGALGAILFAAFTLLLAAALHLRLLAGGGANGLPHDSDGWVRMLRVRLLWEEGDWFTTIVPHLSAPEGLSVHWTRPLDVMILVPAWIAAHGFGADWREALVWSGALVCPVLHALTALAAGWAARHAWPDLPMAPYYAVALLFSSGILAGYSVVGRADHHVLVVLAVVVGLGFAAAAASMEARRGAAIGAGIAFGFGVWVSPEALMVAVPSLAAFGVAWLLLRDGRRAARQGMRMAAAMAATVAVAVVMERPPSDWLAVEYDKVSSHHVLIAVLIAAVFAGVLPLSHRRMPLRLLGGGAIAAAGAGLLVLIHPGTFGASLSGADSAAATLFLPFVLEMQPIRLTSQNGFATALSFAGLAPAALIAAIALAWRGRHDGGWQRGVLLLLAVMATLVATLAYRRFATNFAGVAAVAAAGLMGLIARATWPVAVRIPLMFATLGLLFGMGYLGFLFQRAPGEGDVVAAEPPRGCHARELTNWLLTLAPEDDRRQAPIVMMSDLNQTAELAWRTHLRYVASPYHRGGGAIADTAIVFNAAEDAVAEAVLRRRDVTYVLACPQSFAADGAFAQRLIAGDVPAWLEPVTPPEGHEAGDARLYRLR
ncbi:MAG TPA: hypothetical protein VD970_02285 [Acetobacteraceae bacterium]|nr:hypothetical protein [Acetobacteraceae bacterium]